MSIRPGWGAGCVSEGLSFQLLDRCTCLSAWLRALEGQGSQETPWRPCRLCPEGPGALISAPWPPKSITVYQVGSLPRGPLRGLALAGEGAHSCVGDTAGSNQNPTEAEPEGTPEALGQFPPFAG